MSENNVQSRNSKIRDWIIESAIICISILLAFALANWGEQRTIDERTQSVMCNIREEMTFNYDLLVNDYQSRHKALIAYVEGSIKQVKEDPELESSLPLIDRPILVDNLRSTAWMLALETGYLLHVDFKLATKVAAVYELQEKSYKRTFEGVVETLFSNLKNNNGEVTIKHRQEVLLVLTEWYLQEQYLLDNYSNLMKLPAVEGMECMNET